jgi:hypothetical protein
MSSPTPSDEKKLRRKNRTVFVTLAVCITFPILAFALRKAHLPEWLLKSFIGVIVVVWLVSFGWIIPENCEGFFRGKK